MYLPVPQFIINKKTRNHFHSKARLIKSLIVFYMFDVTLMAQCLETVFESHIYRKSILLATQISRVTFLLICKSLEVLLFTLCFVCPFDLIRSLPIRIS